MIVTFMSWCSCWHSLPMMFICIDDFGNEVRISDESKKRAWYFLGVYQALSDS